MSFSVNVTTWTSIEALLAEAQSQLDRVTLAEALAEQRAGAHLIDIRSGQQRLESGEIAGATVIERNVLEWRLDPASAHRDERFAYPGARIILICHEGYQSSLAAATLRTFGLDATDVIDGYEGSHAR